MDHVWLWPSRRPTRPLQEKNGMLTGESRNRDDEVI